MEITLSKTDMKSALAKVTPLKRGCMKGMALFSIEAIAGTGEDSPARAVFTGANPNIRTVVTIPATVTTPGKVGFSLDGKASDIFSQCPGAEVSINRNGNVVHVKSNKMKANVPTISDDALLATVAETEDEIKATYTLSGEELANVIRRSTMVCRGETPGEATNAVAMKFTSGSAAVMASDRKRISVSNINSTGDVEELVVLSEDMIDALGGIIDTDKDVILKVTESNATIESGNASTTVTRSNINYPSLADMIPAEFETVVGVPRTAFIETIKRMMIANENCITITFGEKVIVSASSPAIGEMSEELDDVTTDKTFSVIFKPSYVIECLESQKAETINLRFVSTSEVKAVSVSGDPDYIYLVMPMTNPV